MNDPFMKQVLMQFAGLGALLTIGMPVLGMVAIATGWIGILSGRTQLLRFIRAVGTPVGPYTFLFAAFVCQMKWNPAGPLLCTVALTIWFAGAVAGGALQQDGLAGLSGLPFARRLEQRIRRAQERPRPDRRTSGERRLPPGLPHRLLHRLLPWAIAGLLLMPLYPLPLAGLAILTMAWMLHNETGTPSLRLIRVFGYTMGTIIVLGAALLVQFGNPRYAPTLEIFYFAGLIFWFGGGILADRHLLRRARSGQGLPAAGLDKV